MALASAAFWYWSPYWDMRQMVEAARTPTGGRDRWRLLGPQGEAHAVPIRSRFTSNNGEALRQAALAGGGILMQWEALVREDLAARRLVRVLPRRHAPPPRETNLLTLPDRRPSAKLQCFVEYVRKYLGG